MEGAVANEFGLANYTTKGSPINRNMRFEMAFEGQIKAHFCALLPNGVVLQQPFYLLLFLFSRT
mgnify:CR=1 FL=1